jgi:hypothetical protein
MSTLESQLSNSQQGEVESPSKIQFSKRHRSSNSLVGPRNKDTMTTPTSMMSHKSRSHNANEAFTVEQLDGRLEK